MTSTQGRSKTSSRALWREWLLPSAWLSRHPRRESAVTWLKGRAATPACRSLPLEDQLSHKRWLPRRWRIISHQTSTERSSRRNSPWALSMEACPISRTLPSTRRSLRPWPLSMQVSLLNSRGSSSPQLRWLVRPKCCASSARYSKTEGTLSYQLLSRSSLGNKCSNSWRSI